MDDLLGRILEAVATGDLLLVREHLIPAEHKELCSPEGKSFLHVAAECGHSEIVAFLLESGWPVNAKTGEGETPLHFAARARIFAEGNMADLLQGSQGGPWAPREQKQSAAIEEAILELVRLRGMGEIESFAAIDDLPYEQSGPLYEFILGLLGDRARLYRELTAAGVSFDPRDPAFQYVNRGRTDYLAASKALITYGAEVNVFDSNGRLPLHYAVESNLPQMVELLLANKADPNLKQDAAGSWHGWSESPMELALDCNVEAAKVLYQYGGKVDFENDLPMHRAASNGRLEMVAWLTEIGGDIDQRDAEGDTPLLCAAHGHENVIAALCQRNADVSAVNAKGQGVLHLSAGCPTSLAYFLNRGLDSNRPDEEGSAPLHYAARCAAEETIPLLVAEGANVNAQDNQGNTPLHSIFFGDELRPDIEYPTFKALVEGGADTTIKNHEGKTPLDLAREYQYPGEYLELLGK